MVISAHYAICAFAQYAGMKISRVLCKCTYSPRYRLTACKEDELTGYYVDVGNFRFTLLIVQLADNFRD